MKIKPGDDFDEFRIIDYIGMGGFGIVYHGYDRVNLRDVAIKELNCAKEDRENILRFKQEGKILRELNHPNIVAYYGLRFWHDRYYLIMEYVSGGDLRNHLKSGSQFTIDQVIRVGEQVCSALDTVHQSGIIHRDLKPENVLLTKQGNAKVTDFGISYLSPIMGGYKFSENGFQPGTLLYMSPQQVRGEQVDRSTDVYALGILLAELLTSKPFINIETITAQAQLLAKNSPKPKELLIRDLVIEAIQQRRMPNFLDMRPDIPSWLEESVQMAIVERISTRALLQVFQKRRHYYEIHSEINFNISKNDLLARIRPILNSKIKEDLIFNQQLGIRSIMDHIVAVPWKTAPFLWIYLVVDQVDSFEYLQSHVLEKFGIGFDQVYTIAFNNLDNVSQEIIPEITRDASGQVVMVAINHGDAYDASRILLRDVRKNLCDLLEVKKCLAGIPDRDLLLAFLPRSEIVRITQKKIQEQFVTKSYPITDELFELNNPGNIALLRRL